MNDAIEILDEFLFAHPHPHEWNDDDRARFEELRADLRRACD
jgi:hypothetical protein